MFKRLWFAITGIWWGLIFLLNWFGVLETAKGVLHNRGKIVKTINALIAWQWFPLSLFVIGIIVLLCDRLGLFGRLQRAFAGRKNNPVDELEIPSERPFITITPMKQDDYINVIEGPDSITVEMMFEIKNSGLVETEAFLVSGETATINPSTGKTQITSAQTYSQGVALASGQKFGIKTVSIHKDQTPEQRTAFLAELRSATLVPESSKGVYTTELCIEYTNPRVKGQRFRTRAVFKQTVNEAMIVNQAYDDQVKLKQKGE